MDVEPHRGLELRVRAAGELQLHRGERHRPGELQTGLNDEEKLHGLAFGGGLMYGTGNGGFSLGLDYAYKYLGILGPTNFFSFTLGW